MPFVKVWIQFVWSTKNPTDESVGYFEQSLPGLEVRS